jgi:hypothetical protein
VSDRELDEIADALYALHPDAFAAERDERVREARAQGKAALARELARLRRPTMSAWLVNLLWRDQPGAVEQLLGIAGELARAQAQGSGQALRSLTAQRREVETALMKRAHALAEEAGVKVSQAMAREAQDTLGAAMARPDVAAEVRSGRLVKPATYAGFGDLVMVMPAAPGHAEDGGTGRPAGSGTGAAHTTAPRADAAAAPKTAPTADAAGAHPTAPAADDGAAPSEAPGRVAAAPRERASGAPTPIRPTKADDRAARAAQREAERRQEAERRLQDARAALEAAVAALADEARAAESARRRHEELRAEVEELRERLRAREQERATAESAARIAATRRDRAERAHEAALRGLERAEQEVADTTGAG